jgi:hypothetical protein
MKECNPDERVESDDLKDLISTEKAIDVLEERKKLLESKIINEFAMRYRHCFPRKKEEAWANQGHGYSLNLIDYSKDSLDPNEDYVRIAACWTGRGYSGPGDYDKYIDFKFVNLTIPLEQLTKDMFVVKDY